MLLVRVHDSHAGRGRHDCAALNVRGLIARDIVIAIGLSWSCSETLPRGDATLEAERISAKVQLFCGDLAGE